MKIIQYPLPETWKDLVKRPESERNSLQEAVRKIFSEVKKTGDKALFKYTIQYDNVELQSLEVSSEEIKKSETLVTEDLKKAILQAKKNIEKFHLSQKEDIKVVETQIGVKCWRESRAIEKVGLYIPGGTAPLFSTVLMLGVPAQIAGCEEIILCTPPDEDGNIHPAIIYAATIVGIKKIYKIGGIQAIAALSIGTETIPNVYKIFGPGNQYVTAAKQHAQEYKVGIDLPAGPSEVLVIADEQANPEFVASDLLSQAEHGADSQVVFLTTSEEILDKTLMAIDEQIKKLPRKSIIEKALENSLMIRLKTIEDCFHFSNLYAPEHLILAIENSNNYTFLIKNAGSVFLGNYSCESAGDYASGTNHTLPTNGYAVNYSGVSLDSFIKKITFQELTIEGLQSIGKTIEVMAESECLMGHKNAVTVRLKEDRAKQNSKRK